jgi:hypothetical protein
VKNINTLVWLQLEIELIRMQNAKLAMKFQEVKGLLKLQEKEKA